MCGPLCSICCALTSAFGVVFMASLGYLIKTNYPYVGEWADSEEEKEHRSAEAASNCFAVAGVYGAFLAISMVSWLWSKRKTSRLP
eukprot:jgi/Chlat1/3508/Chrsp23S03697